MSHLCNLHINFELFQFQFSIHIFNPVHIFCVTFIDVNVKCNLEVIVHPPLHRIEAYADNELGGHLCPQNETTDTVSNKQINSNFD